MNPNDIIEDHGYPFMILDLVTQVLSMASKPSQAGDYLTEQLRELTGAKTVAVIESQKETLEADRIVSVDPQRRRKLVESKEVSELIDTCHMFDEVTVLRLDEPTGKTAEMIKKLGIELSMAVPLKVGGLYVGTILLLDMPQEQFLDKVVQALEMISPAAALILRNSFLYSKQELLVDQRTQELSANEQQLRASNQQLIASEQQLKASNQQLMASSLDREKLVKNLVFKNKELQDIVYSASHDLRSPLVNIEGFSNILEEDCGNLGDLLAMQINGDDKKEEIEKLLQEGIPESLGFITQSAKNMASLLDGLLQVSRVGSIEIISESLDMNKTVREVLAAMEHQINERKAVVTLDSLPGCIADPHMMDHVLTNLISNAVKYLDSEKEGEIRISGKVEDGMSIYCVQDNGIGIATDHQPKVFELFHRLDPEGPADGEGLGLTIVTRIMDRMGGKVWVESKISEGSRFFVSLPTVKA